MNMMFFTKIFRYICCTISHYCNFHLGPPNYDIFLTKLYHSYYMKLQQKSLLKQHPGTINEPGCTCYISNTYFNCLNDFNPTLTNSCDNSLCPVINFHFLQYITDMVFNSLFTNIKGFGNRPIDRKSTRLNSSHVAISYAVFCLK